jgi:L-ascorbate metabolism protein UlaG (beta-lactamase superfamily)
MEASPLRPTAQHLRRALFGAALLQALLVYAQPAAAPKPYPSPRHAYPSPRYELTAPELPDAPDEWIDRSIQWVNDILDSYGPDVVEHPVRRAALIRLDDILHIDSAPAKTLVQQFYRARIEKAVKEIEATRVTSGMRIWKLYNHGFFVRTPSVSFTFDIVPGTRMPGFEVDAKVLERLAGQSDALLISHMHNDHASQIVAKLFLDRKKPVVAPEGLWSGQDIAARLIFPKPSATTIHEIPIQNGRQVLKVVVYPGHQGARVTNNVQLLTTPDGFTVVHTGDQSGAEGPGSDFDWIANIGYQHRVDLLMPNCWTTDMQRVARGVDPKLIITGHENEMGHAVKDRRGYTQTYNHLFGSHYPFIVMGWGESYYYPK